MMKKQLRKLATILTVTTVCVFGPYIPSFQALSPILQTHIVAQAEAAIWSLDTLATALVGLGTGGVILLFVTSVVGVAGGAAIVASLCALGGPFGILGGIAGLGIISFIAWGLANYGLEAILMRWCEGMKEKGHSFTEIRSEIESVPSYVLSDGMKAKLIFNISKYF